MTPEPTNEPTDDPTEEYLGLAESDLVEGLFRFALTAIEKAGLSEPRIMFSLAGMLLSGLAVQYDRKPNIIIKDTRDHLHQLVPEMQRRRDAYYRAKASAH